MSATASTIPSPDPKTLGLSVFVNEAALANTGGVLPAGGTPYGDSSWKSILPADYRKLWGTALYIGQGEKVNGGIMLNFSPYKTEDEANTPYRTMTSFDEFYWDGILYTLVFVKDKTTDQYRVHPVYVPGGKRGTKFITEDFLSPIPFNIRQYNSPVPTSVGYSAPGASGAFPECLHPKMVIPLLLGGGTVTHVIGDRSALGGNQDQQVFPETNVLEWERRVLLDKQTIIPAGFHRTRVTIIPPEVPDPARK